MKPKINLPIASSVKAQAGAGAEPAKPETRLPVDPAKRALNRTLNAQTVLNLLAGTLPDVMAKAFQVGAWVWIAFDTAPAPEVRQQLSQIGFQWNTKRQLWQHPCGKYTYGSQADPRDTYTTKPAMEAYKS
jgi:hypothetical protein